MKEHKIEIQYKIYEDKNELLQEEQNLYSKSVEAMKKAYAPYSKFKVGAAILMEDGQIFTGSNQENAAYPSGLCAERTALFYAKGINENLKIKTIAVCTNRIERAHILSPCGQCRQAIQEYEKVQKQPIRILFEGIDSKIISVDSCADLLPFGFSPDVLI